MAKTKHIKKVKPAKPKPGKDGAPPFGCIPIR